VLGELALRACDRDFLVRCQDAGIAALVNRAFGGLRVDHAVLPVASYNVARRWPDGFHVWNKRRAASPATEAQLLFQLDKDMTLALQHERPDLFFLHAAVVASGGCAVVLPAFAGTGKSTLTLALTGLGLDYLSDELAPVDLARTTVFSYPHALCLKSPPPPPYELPRNTLAVDRRLHVPVDDLPTAGRGPLPIVAVVFLRREGDLQPALRSMTPASAAARFMAHALNALAHSGHGLDAAVTMSQSVPCFDLDTTNLPAAADAVASLLPQPACGHARSTRCFNSMAV
jgi:hypothetical protein